MDEDGQLIGSIHEENPWTKVGDSMLGEIPVIGMFAGYMFQPKYLLSSTDGKPMMRLSKKPAMWERKFEIEELMPMDPVDELRTLMGFIMMTLLERARG